MWTAKLRGVRRVSGLHPAPDGRWLAVGGPAHLPAKAAVWLAGGAARACRLPARAAAYAVSPAADRLVLWSRDADRVGWLDPRAEAPPLHPVPDDRPGHIEWLAAAFGPGGRVAASDHYWEWPPGGPMTLMTNRLVVRDAGTWAVLASTGELGHALGCVTVSPDGTRVAVTGGREYPRSVSEFAADCRPTAVYDPPAAGGTQAAAYSPCGRWLVALNGRVGYRFPVGGGKPAMLRGHARKLTAAAFVPDGRLLTAGLDGAVRTWDVDAGREVSVFDPAIGPQTAVAVAADGLTAAAAGAGTVVVWDL